MFYTDKATNEIYEVQFFDEFIMIRPAGVSSGFPERLDFNSFNERFRESYVTKEMIYGADYDESEGVRDISLPSPRSKR